METNSQRVRLGRWMLVGAGLGVSLLLPIALLLFFVPLRQVFWGFDDQPLPDVFFWFVVGIAAAIMLFALACSLSRDGERRTARNLLVAVAVFELLAWPCGVLMTHYVERVKVHGILYSAPE
ncbi:hypothetical protein [Verrucomicrobium sp. BvORR106]|uniref:hypothetical protein n=1 Tax=Verrucomicrobium sp. BvORR106 TaxID=1403819 RepID=UPI00056DE640|nr:hypothetical protein [Verrucomicrobium sp. BvORR106]